MRFIKIHPNDNVAVALTDLACGETCAGVTLREKIGRGHKFALTSIPEGGKIIKYGMPIGTAKCAIQPGGFVHTHNLKTALDGLLEYCYEPDSDFVPLSPALPETFFMGYRRSDGRVGIRNNIWIIPTVGCVNKLAENLARTLNRVLPSGSVNRAVALTHPYGCSQLGDDHEMTRHILANLARHPNAGGVLIVGLGCENNTVEAFEKLLEGSDRRRIRVLTAQQEKDEFAKGMEILRELADQASADVRTPIPLAELVVGLKCGGSDGLSGITANALTGRFSDQLNRAGGTAILGEVPEMFGAETLLMNRCVNREVYEKCVSMVNDFKNYFLRYNQVIYENPSPGNKAGGISSLEDKSLGCVQKGGSAPVVDVLPPAGRVAEKGLNLMSGPGNDMVASTLLAAAGAHLILFTTGRGTPFGSVVPTVKISSNSPLAENKPHWIDFDAGRLVADHADRQKIDGEFFRKVIAIASGEEQTRNEENGYEEIAIFKDGVTL